MRLSDCSYSDRSVSSVSGKRILSDEVAGGKQCNCGFLATRRDDSDFQPPALEIENRIGRVALREQGAFGIAVDNPSARSSAREEVSKIECRRQGECVNVGVIREGRLFLECALGPA